jgi:hypothetical protein
MKTDTCREIAQSLPTGVEAEEEEEEVEEEVPCVIM